MNRFWCVIALTFCVAVAVYGEERQHDEASTGMDLMSRIYNECATLACAKPKLLSFFSTSMNRNKIRITRDLSIVRSADDASSPAVSESDEINYRQQIASLSEDEKEALRSYALDKMDDFISTHELRLRVPKELVAAPVARFVPTLLMKNIPAEIRVPLAGSEAGQERGFVKKVIVPFLLGLKFKATALLPLALALIALKTWKALTLGLLSLVLSGALMMFKFATKPKQIVSYEVVHAHPPVFHAAPIPPHYIDHHHDHLHEHGPFQKRSVDNTAYRAHRR